MVTQKIAAAACWRDKSRALPNNQLAQELRIRPSQPRRTLVNSKYAPELATDQEEKKEFDSPNTPWVNNQTELSDPEDTDTEAIRYTRNDFEDSDQIQPRAPNWDQQLPISLPWKRSE